MENEIFTTKRAGFYGKKEVGILHLKQWQAEIDRRVKRIEDALKGETWKNLNKK